MEAIRELIGKLRGKPPEGERRGTYKAVKKLEDERGLSPVISTVILVAVAITVAVAVSYWMSGIASQYTAFEKVEIQTAICTWDDTTAGDFEWTIEIQLKNSGTATATLTNIFINDIEVDKYYTTTAITSAEEGKSATDMSQTKIIESGEIATINVFIDGPGDTGDGDPKGWQKVSSGTTINIKIHSAGGLDYIKLVKLT